MDVISIEVMWKVWLFVSGFNVILSVGYDWHMIKNGRYRLVDWSCLAGCLVVGPVLWIALFVACALNGDVGGWIKKGLATLGRMVKNCSKKK